MKVGAYFLYSSAEARTGLWRRVLALFGASCLVATVWAQAPSPGTARAPDVPYQPTEMKVVQVMLQLGRVKAGDVVYDLGCGDGRIVIAAVRDRGARGVCVDIDPQRIAEAQDNARRAGVADRIRFLTQDLFETDISQASAVMLFLWPDVNLALRPKLLRELRPGARVVSHMHDMGEWKPQKTAWVSASDRERVVYLWTIPRPARRR
ncbi:MAG: class I SAM-dependent methyltransferase [Betaproteobacteria bacterium]|nr:class I SAM-dependent methyltransferase [Betaproteobacteria bacterium]